MANDLYGLDPQIGGAWQLDGVVLHIQDAEELVVTSANMNYNRGTTKFSPLNQRKRYIVTGEANGQITLGMIIGPSRDIKNFLERYADACRVTENVLAMQPAGIKECEDTDQSPIEFQCNGVLMNSFQVSLNQLGQAMTVVSAGLGMSFISLSVK